MGPEISSYRMRFIFVHRPLAINYIDLHCVSCVPHQSQVFGRSCLLLCLVKNDFSPLPISLSVEIICSYAYECKSLTPHSWTVVGREILPQNQQSKNRWLSHVLENTIIWTVEDFYCQDPFKSLVVVLVWCNCAALYLGPCRIRLAVISLGKKKNHNKNQRKQHPPPPNPTQKPKPVFEILCNLSGYWGVLSFMVIANTINFTSANFV